MLKPFKIVFLSILIGACSRGYGNKLTDPQIDIYFEFAEDEQKANALGKFWKNNGLIGHVHQNIRLTKDTDHYYVQLLANDTKNADNISFKEMKLLMELQHKLDSAIFNSGIGCQIVICDKNFKPLFNINR